LLPASIPATDAGVPTRLTLPADPAARLGRLRHSWCLLSVRPWHRERGHSGWSPSSGLGLALGAEPSLPLRCRDYRFVVPATTQHVVDAVALRTDVAFDPTARQIVVSSGLRRQSLATPPVPRRHELTGP